MTESKHEDTVQIGIDGRPVAELIWFADMTAPLFSESPVSRIGVDLFDTMVIGVLIKLGLVAQTEAEDGTRTYALVPMYRRRPLVIVTVCLALELIVESEGTGRDLRERLELASDERNWRRRERLPKSIRPLVKKVQAQIPAEFTELRRLSLPNFWWIISPLLIREGLIRHLEPPPQDPEVRDASVGAIN